MATSDSEPKIIYRVFGPFAVFKKKDGLLDRDRMAALWEEVEQCEEGLSNACGCYVISVRKTVWYVGLAKQQSFACECSTADKINKFNYAIHKGKGNAYLHLLARTTPCGKFASASSSHNDISQLERILIPFAFQRNEDLLNKKYTKFLRGFAVPGILNSPPGHGKAHSVQTLRKVLGIRPSIIVAAQTSKDSNGGPNGSSTNDSTTNGVATRLKEIIDAGILNPPIKLTATYHDRELEAKVCSNGIIVFNGTELRTCTAAAKAAMSQVKKGNHEVNGWKFWYYRNDAGEVVLLNEARRAYVKSKAT